jgi:hypothetical protein
MSYSNLHFANLVGQSFDGAASMSGVHNGIQKRNSELAPEAV